MKENKKEKKPEKEQPEEPEPEQGYMINILPTLSLIRRDVDGKVIEISASGLNSRTARLNFDFVVYRLKNDLKIKENDKEEKNPLTG